MPQGGEAVFHGSPPVCIVAGPLTSSSARVMKESIASRDEARSLSIAATLSNDLPTETGTLLDLVSKQSKVVEVGGTTAKRLVLELRSVVRLEGQLASDGK